MLQAGAHTTLKNSTIANCTALSGGGVCTDMADAAPDGKSTKFDRRTALSVQYDGVFGNAGGDVVAGPYFELNKMHKLSSAKVHWWHRLCNTGYYLSKDTGFCAECPANTYSVQGTDPDGPDQGHTSPNCSTAPPSGFAPGGAMLLSLSEHWHHADDGHNDTVWLYQGCTDCHVGDLWVPDLREIRR